MDILVYILPLNFVETSIKKKIIIIIKKKNLKKKLKKTMYMYITAKHVQLFVTYLNNIRKLSVSSIRYHLSEIAFIRDLIIIIKNKKK